MNNFRLRLSTHIAIIVTGILLSTIAIANSAYWIGPSTVEHPTYVILAQRDIEKTKAKKQELTRDINIARIAD